MDENFKRYRRLIEASLDPLFTVSLNGSIMDCNEAAIKMTGEERNVLLSSDLPSYFTDPDEGRQILEDVFAREAVVDLPLPSIRTTMDR